MVFRDRYKLDLLRSLEYRISLGRDSPSSSITVFSSSRVFNWKSCHQRLRWQSFNVGESHPRVLLYMSPTRQISTVTQRIPNCSVIERSFFGQFLCPIFGRSGFQMVGTGPICPDFFPAKLDRFGMNKIFFMTLISKTVYASNRTIKVWISNGLVFRCPGLA
jgi:hypothetical protein